MSEYARILKFVNLSKLYFLQSTYNLEIGTEASLHDIRQFSYWEML